MKNIILTIFTVLAAATNCAYAQEVSRPEIFSPTEQYTVIKKLGEGFFGEIFAVMSSQGQPFALKSYKIFDQDLRSDTQREFLNGQILQHPNIIKSHELFTTETDKKYLVLDLVDGHTLLKAQKGLLSYEESLNAALKLCDALKYALLLDFVHLDLNPTNVMLTTNKDIMIIDLASFLSFEDMLQLNASQEMQGQRGPQRGQQKAVKKPQANSQQACKPRKKEKRAQRTPTPEQLKRDFSPSYLNAITETCAIIITKSDLPRADKYSLKAEIKKISWDYEEDLEDSCEESLEIYLDRLIERLQSAIDHVAR